MYIYGPIAFMKDGLVTRQGVNSFDELYELGPARRHKCENGTRIYIVYFGWSAPKVKKEIVYAKNYSGIILCFMGYKKFCIQN